MSTPRRPRKRVLLLVLVLTAAIVFAVRRATADRGGTYNPGALH